MPLQLPLDNFWLYFLASIGTLVVSFIAVFVGYFLISLLRGWWIKRRIPKVKDPKLNYSLADPGKPGKLTEKEVEDNERQQFSRFREFEKLRRFTEKSGESKGATSASGRFSRPALDVPTERREVPDEDEPSSPSEHERDPRSSARGTKEAVQRSRFTRPEFL